MPRPRVISEFIPSPLSSPLAAAARVPAIIGEGATTFTVTEQVTKGAVNGTDNLAHVALSIIRIGDYSTTKDYDTVTDYLLTGGDVDWSPAGTEPATGQKYFVTYTYAKAAADYDPKFYDNFDAVLSAYGPVTQTGGALDAAAYITEAAQIMMGPGIGAQRLIVVQVAAAVPGAPTASEFNTALAKLVDPVGPLSVDPYYIVPLIGRLSDGDVALVNASCLGHAIQMADPQFLKERRIYTGQKSNSSFNNVVSAATALGVDANSSRLTMMANYDPQVTISTPTGSATVTLDGSFAAGAVAAYRSTQQVSQPALNRLLPAFNTFGTRFSSVQIDALDDAGVTVLEEVAGTVRLVNDVTVRVVNDIEKSIPTVETRDSLIASLRRRLKAVFIGLRGSPSIPAEIERETDSYLDEERGNGDIQAYSPSKASRVPNTTTKFQVTFSYFPAGEVLEIKVRFSIDLSLV